MTLYNFAAVDINGEIVSFDRYAKQVVVVVNTASHCGFTNQYQGLESLYKKYKDQGLVILAFPCNQFANQEPADEFTIKHQCLAKFGISFPVFSKVDVNGKDAIALFKWLKWAQPGFINSLIKWNFTKFVIDRNGKAIKRFSPFTTPETIEKFLIDSKLVSEF
jgi:glutathione peroxidase